MLFEGEYAVAKSQEAIREYEDFCDDSNWEYFDASKEELTYLFAEGGVFEQINEQCHLLIDWFEEELICGDNILTALDIVKKDPRYDRLVFTHALRKAAEYGYTAVSVSS